MWRDIESPPKYLNNKFSSFSFYFLTFFFVVEQHRGIKKSNLK
nr:MAG TPA: hypothetical protein [Caudoviricetes sp.]